MLRFYWTPVVASRAHVFYPLTTQEAPWSRIILAFVWTTAYLCIPGQLLIADSLDTVKISKRFASANKLSKWHFGKLEYLDLGEGPPLIFRPNWDPKGQKNSLADRVPSPLSQGLDDRVLPPPYLKVWIRHCIINSYYSPVPLKPLLAL